MWLWLNGVWQNHHSHSWHDSLCYVENSKKSSARRSCYQVNKWTRRKVNTWVLNRPPYSGEEQLETNIKGTWGVFLRAQPWCRDLPNTNTELPRGNIHPGLSSCVCCWCICLVKYPYHWLLMRFKSSVYILGICLFREVDFKVHMKDWMRRGLQMAHLLKHLLWTH